MIKTQTIEVHWNYLLSIEKDLETVSRFIELHEDNFKCFSIEISRLLMATAAEVDVVCKQICKNIDSRSKANSINKYQAEILRVHNSIPKFEIVIPRYGLTLEPWQNWEQNSTPPSWWTAYNKIKHHRHTNYADGNLKNALNAVAGLFVMILYLYRDKARSGDLLPMLHLLHVTDEHYNGTTMGSREIGINYNI